MQLDAEEDGEPFFKPQQVNTAPTASSKRKDADEEGVEASQRSPSREDDGMREGETAQAAAATATAEQEE